MSNYFDLLVGVSEKMDRNGPHYYSRPMNRLVEYKQTALYYEHTHMAIYHHRLQYITVVYYYNISVVVIAIDIIMLYTYMYESFSISFSVAHSSFISPFRICEYEYSLWTGLFADRSALPPIRYIDRTRSRCTRFTTILYLLCIIKRNSGLACTVCENIFLTIRFIGNQCRCLYF